MTAYRSPESRVFAGSSTCFRWKSAPGRNVSVSCGFTSAMAAATLFVRSSGEPALARTLSRAEANGNSGTSNCAMGMYHVGGTTSRGEP